ncbi:MAG: DUF2207 domain-containing protein [Alphaproteobacteria bacterium]|nr:DUF2207 domain-containing protein [Alphaproteobacteria bacterium]
MKRFGAFVALLALWVAPAVADERITDFSSDIAVAGSGTLTVTETISVIAEGDAIRHGIFRVIPTRYTDRLGNSIHVGLSVASVMRDGHAEPYTIENSEDGRSIKIGDKDVFVDPGRHTYTIQYQTTRQIGFYKGYDELYWNVTGNFWKFPIDRAEAHIQLPVGGKIKQYALYTGAAGAKSENAEALLLSGNAIAFHTTEPLGLGEGLTVAVGFAKGAVLPPSRAELRRRYLEDNAPSIVAWAAMFMLFIYYFIAWWSHGRDPRRGVVIPLFGAPQGFSPAAARFVNRMAYDRKCYAASLVDMAVKRYLTISESGGTYTLTRTGQDEAALSSGEAAMARKLFKRRDTIVLKDENHETVAASISALEDSLENEYERVYFNTNTAWFAGGVAILIVGAIATALMCDDWGTACGVLAAIAVASGAAAFLLHRAFKAWAGVVSGPGSRVLNVLGAIFATIFAIPVAGLAVAIVTFVTHDVPAAALVALIAGGIMSYVFYHLLKAPTLAGAKILDEIAGFKMYLTTAEKNRLEVLNPPEVTPEVFERFLPYAIALDCENQWSRKFEAEAAAAGNDPTSGGRAAYVPVWYSGSSFDRLGTAGFTSALGSSIASAAASAATPPGSSSGSGGGGFSGGGGGGGGGGGW